MTNPESGFRHCNMLTCVRTVLLLIHEEWHESHSHPVHVQTVSYKAVNWSKWKSQHVSNFIDSYFTVSKNKFCNLVYIFLCFAYWWMSWGFSIISRGYGALELVKLWKLCVLHIVHFVEATYSALELVKLPKFCVFHIVRSVEATYGALGLVKLPRLCVLHIVHSVEATFYISKLFVAVFRSWKQNLMQTPHHSSKSAIFWVLAKSQLKWHILLWNKTSIYAVTSHCTDLYQAENDIADCTVSASSSWSGKSFSCNT
jgi:hypothetical protein